MSSSRPISLDCEDLERLLRRIPSPGERAVALIGVTLLAIQGYEVIEARLRKYQEYIPKAMAGLFVLMAILYLLRLL